VQQHILQMMLGPSQSMAIQAMESMSGPSPWRSDAMTFPVLGLYADHSGAASDADFKKQFPNGKRVEIAGTGHFLMLEKPAEFNKQLMGFLETVKF
jgi:pimeloyl-ACP methyl ester carboxylesterase